MASNLNKVVTFKELYGYSQEIPSDIINETQDFTITNAFKGYVPPLGNYYDFPWSSSNSSTYKIRTYTQEQYDKRLKYLYYGYALAGLSVDEIIGTRNGWNLEMSPIAPATMTGIPIVATSSGKFKDLITQLEKYQDDFTLSGYSSIVGLFPYRHFKNITTYSHSFQASPQYSLLSTTAYNPDTFVTYSEISTMDLRNPQTYEVFTEYHPLIDSSTGEIMKDEEGNVLYEEGESYMEIKSEDSQIL